MSTPEGPGAPRPLRTAAMAMFGVAAIAALIGLVSLASGGDDDKDTAAQEQPTTSSSSAEASAESESSTSAEPSPPPAPTTVPTIAPAPAPSLVPPAPAPPPPPPPPPPSSADFVDQPIRVYNNSTITGLAQVAADDMTNSGWSVIEVGNYSGGVIPTSTVYYQPGQEAAADTLAAEFGLRSEPRFEGLQSASPGIIVIVTKDYNA